MKIRRMRIKSTKDLPSGPLNSAVPARQLQTTIAKQLAHSSIRGRYEIKNAPCPRNREPIIYAKSIYLSTRPAAETARVARQGRLSRADCYTLCMKAIVITRLGGPDVLQLQ